MLDTYVNAFLAQAALHPNHTAVMDRTGALTYGQLNARSALLARRILEACRAQGTDVEAMRRTGKNGVRVALLLPRTRYYLAALLAVLRAGCAAVPMDSEYPTERIQAIRADAECALFVTTAALREKTCGAPAVLIGDAADDGEADTGLNLSDPDIEGLLVYTSGSTGKPKGVVHRQYVYSHYYALNRLAGRPLPPESVHCCMAGFTFIAALFDLTVPVMTGAQVYIADETERQNIDLLHAVILKRRVTSMFLPPRMFMVMRELYGRLPLRNVELGGEKANPKYAGDGNVFEAYASSETFCMLFQQLAEGDPRQLGAPAAGSRIYLVDDDGSLVTQPGRLGELCVVSPWLAVGYNNLPEETAAKFVDCPFEPGARMYRSGDYMSYDEDGRYLFHGRKDRMVKLRGYRVELGEVESAVRRAPGVEEAACVAIRVNGGDKLCCYYTGRETGAGELKALAASLLPGYMVPDYLVWMDALPRNERNKVDYLSLKALEPPQEDEAYLPPQTPTERAVCEAFASALELERVGATADFFDLGGTSLSAAMLIAALADWRGSLSFQDVIAHPTPRALAAFLDEAGARQDALGMDRDFYPLTKTQLGIYLEALTGGNNATYTIPFLVKTAPSVTPDALLRAVEAVLSAHPAMKYVIRAGADGIPHMFMVPEAKAEIPVVEGTEEGRLDFMRRFFPVVPMTEDLLFHFAVYRTPERCYLAAKTHLIFLDGTSVDLLIKDLDQALRGEAIEPEACTVQQAGMLEERMMRDGSHEAAARYHESLFRDMEEIPPLIGDREGPLTPGVSENLRFEPGTLTTERVKAFCLKNKITESSFFMGAMALLLGKYLNCRRISFSTVYNGRAQTGLARTIGTLIKRIPVYGDLSRDLPVEDFLRGVTLQLLGNMSQDIFSFDEVLKACPVNEDVEFIYQGERFTDHAEPSDDGALAAGDRWFIEHYHTGMVTGCLSIQMFATAGLYNMTLEYRNERFSPEWVRRFARNLFTIAEGLLTAENIGDIEMLTADDRRALARFNDTAVAMDFVPVHAQIHRHALKAPGKPAVTAAGKTLTFGELDALSNQLAFALLERGVAPETLVGALFEREIWAYVAEIGILKAGGAFVPFIPDYPDERIDFCMKDGRVPLLLTTEALAGKRPGLAGEGRRVLTLEALLGVGALDDIRPDAAPADQPDVAIGPGNLAYCIYTSGTTGRPKGVMIEHGNIANYVHRNEKSPEIMHYAAPGRVCLALASFAFDVSVVEAFVPLCNGNPVVIATEAQIHTPALLAKLIVENGVNGITCTPTYLLNLLDIPDTREAIRRLTFFDIGAEAFPAPLYDRLRELRGDSVILNVYGPTEATMGCAAEEMRGEGAVTVGTPIANTAFIVADPFGNPLPAGVRGELVICGAQVGRGYVNLPDRTAESFFIHDGRRAYRSGDLAAWTEDGRIRIFGRIDNQIKLRGFRIELDEIEKVLSEFPGVRLGAAAVRKNGGAEYLVGYYAARTAVDPQALRRHLQQKLPEYMVPSLFVALESMPTTASGKVDRRALPNPDFSALRAAYVAPQTDGERAVCAAFAKALRLDADRIGALDDFFELGGDSLRAMVALAEADLDGLSAADIFQRRTPRAIAAAAAARADEGSLEERDEAARKAPHPLTPLQLQMIDTQLFKPGSTMWSNTHFLVRFDPAEVDAERLCRAVNRALQNHPGLSTAFRFNEDGELVQQVVPGLLPEVKVRSIRAETAQMLPDVLVLPFDRLTDACLCRAGVFRAPEDLYLFMDVHHLLMDGASLGVVLADIVNAYFGRELKRDCYFALLAEEEKRIAGGAREADRDWFRARYGDELWCNMPPVASEDGAINQASRQRRLSFDAAQVAQAEAHWGVTHSVMAIAAALLALYRFTGKRHVMVNWIFNNRLSQESESAVGMLIKNLPAAARMEELPSLRALLESVKEQVAEGIAHNTYDFMTEHYRAYLDDCMEVNLQLGINGNELAPLHPRLVPLEDEFTAAGARLELELLENEYGDGGFDSEMEYAQGLFDGEQLAAFHDLYVRLLEGLIHRTIEEAID